MLKFIFLSIILILLACTHEQVTPAGLPCQCTPPDERRYVLKDSLVYPQDLPEPGLDGRKHIVRDPWIIIDTTTTPVIINLGG